MRKIERELVKAFIDGKPFCKSNSIVEIDGLKVTIKLHDNPIVTRERNELTVRTCGWQSNTTKSRLNAVLRRYALPGVQQRNFEWSFTDGEPFPGSRTFTI